MSRARVVTLGNGGVEYCRNYRHINTVYIGLYPPPALPGVTSLRPCGIRSYVKYPFWGRRFVGIVRIVGIGIPGGSKNE